MVEMWICIRGYSKYQVSNLGRVRSTRNNKIKILAPKPRLSGYIVVYIIKDNGKPRNELVHRLVAGAFLHNPEGKQFVDHINRDRSDNRLQNLRWATSAENGQNKNIAKRFKVRPVVQYDQMHNVIKIWESVISIERELNISSDRIRTSCNNKQILCGFYWLYQDTIPIEGEEWRYINIGGHTISASSAGRIRTVAGNITYGHQVNMGYRAVHVGDITMVVHKIVCQAFKPIEEIGNYQVNHIDGDKHNNKISNLEWTTPSQNAQHAVSMKPTKSQRPVIQMTSDGQIIKHHSTLKQAAQELGVHICCIINVCNGKYQTSMGYKWKYANELI